MKKLDRLAARTGLPGWALGVVAALALVLAGRAVLDLLLPGGAAGAEVGWALFIVLTGMAVEQADQFATLRFWAWVGSGAVLSLLVGAICRALSVGDG